MIHSNSPSQINNKNVLSKKALDALNATQQIFPFHKNSSNFKSKKSVISRQDSVRSSLSRLSDGTSKRRIGGLARRRMARQSTRHIAEIKKNMSKEGSQMDDSSMSPVSPRKRKEELTTENDVFQIEIASPEVIKELNQPLDGKISPNLKSSIKSVKSRHGVEIAIDAKLS